MLTTLREVLGEARRGGYAVGLFNTVNLEMARAVVYAAEERRSPAILGSAEVLLRHCSLRELADLLLPMIRRSQVPLVLHFDHGLTEGKVIEALRCGFSSVMYDCSGDPYGENVRKCAEMARIAHAFGATLEAELGHVGSGSDADDGSVYTQPEQAADFCARTGVDALAVAIGTAHGPYLKKPELDLDRLAQIRAAVDTPLVLHGGSGLSDGDFRNCIKGGVTKINIFTDLDRAGAEGARRALEAGERALTGLLPAATAAIQECVAHKMDLFGSSGRA